MHPSSECWRNTWVYNSLHSPWPSKNRYISSFGCESITTTFSSFEITLLPLPLSSFRHCWMFPMGYYTHTQYRSSLTVALFSICLCLSLLFLVFICISVLPLLCLHEYNLMTLQPCDASSFHASVSFQLAVHASRPYSYWTKRSQSAGSVPSQDCCFFFNHLLVCMVLQESTVAEL